MGITKTVSISFLSTSIESLAKQQPLFDLVFSGRVTLAAHTPFIHGVME